MFGHKWVDTVIEGVTKSRLTCQDFKKKAGNDNRNSSEGQNNFCPTPHAASRKILELYSMVKGFPRVKADLSSAFRIAKDGGDDQGQPVMMKPPTEWFENYDVWLLTHEGVPKNSIVWQVDGNRYGRQPTAAQYRDRLEEILLTKLPDRTVFVGVSLTLVCTTVRRRK